MDLLDQELDQSKAFRGVLKPGEMLFTNNLIIPHARESFEDSDDPQKKRHKVRAWIQIFKTQRFVNTACNENVNH